MDNAKKWRIPVFITFLLLGFLLSVQFRTQQIFLSDLSLQKTDDLVLMLKKLHDKRAELTKELSELEKQQHTFNADANAGETLIKGLRQDYQRQQIALGLLPVQGPGITITINTDSSVVYLDLVDIINELWASQAEAIAVNDQRVTPWTYIFWNKQNLSLMMNGVEITFPCTIKAIGNPDQLESGLRLLGGVLDHLAVYKVYPVIKRHQNLELPAASPPEIRYLKGENNG
ncbi:MAG TPA: DUF881 domain-containing protein [Syntrophomonadaceae bacterium]|nr:DUF881 domain-containing protein [Syntrophomonadaceae bacterium]